ncbi:PAS domain-containing sensor histidine kinase [Oryzomonas rubra]|uniref:PAS domain S-box protein n=1 Tax=Oryzomonas rubra TaxID=2509454 RepID=A0A5A9X5N2_9BACT|nr:PAS domain S-box protein [Oryzomonas rubra]KAA0887963.1 PAS domain S-box protein [Oryzomonas rubra]
MDRQTDKLTYQQLTRELADTRLRLAALTQDFSRLNAAYKELMAIEERYRLMFENVPLGYMSMDKNARLIDANQAFADFFGYAIDEIIGKRFADLLVEGVEYHLNVTFPEYVRTGKSKDLVWKVRKKDGSVATIVTNGNARYDENGDFIQTHCMILDVTEHRKAEEALHKSEREKALILGTMSERVIYHDEHCRIVWANHIAAESAGMPLEQLSGKLCYEVYHGRKTPCEDCPAMMVYKTQKPRTGEVHVHGKVLEVVANPVFDKDNHFIGMVQISNDITERKQLERELLDISSRERKRIGHDLHDGVGQQLTGISFLATALRKQLSAITPDAAETADRIVESTEKAKKLMRSILNGLCLVAAEPQGLMEALATLASGVSKLYRVDCTFSCEKPVLIDDIADSTHLFYIAHEAVSNAVKHSGCSRIRISLDCPRGAGRLTVRDNGAGLAPSQSTNNGMGLRIMRYRAVIIGATFEVKGQPGKGTSIVCKIPSSKICTKEH